MQLLSVGVAVRGSGFGKLLSFLLLLPFVTAPSTAVAALPSRFDLTVTADAPDGIFAPGAPLTYRAVIADAAGAALGPLTVRLSVPPEITIDGVIAPGAVTRLDADRHGVTIEGLSLPANGSADVRLLCTLASVEAFAAIGRPFPTLDGLVLAAQGALTDPAAPADGSRPSDDPSTLAADDPTTLVVSAFVELSGSRKVVADVDGGDVEPEDVLEYTLSVVNAGNVATPVVVDDPTPADHGPCVPVAVPMGLTCDAAGLSGTVDVPENGEVTVVFRSSVAAGAPNGAALRNTATLTSALDPSATARPASRVLRVTSVPVLSMDKVAIGTRDGRVEQGGGFVYELTVRNAGNRAASDVRITDTFVGPEDVAASPLDGGRVEAGALVWDLGGLAPGAAARVRMQVDVGPLAPSSASITNQAFVQAAEVLRPVASDDPATPGPPDPTTVIVVSPPPAVPVFTLTKVATDENGGELVAGDVLRYDLRIVASADAQLVDAPVLVDDLPGALTPLEAPGGELGPNGASWTLPRDWRGGEPFGLTLRVQVVEDVLDGSRVLNQAEVRGLPQGLLVSDDPGTAAQADPTAVIVRGRPLVGVVQKAVLDDDGGAVLPGDTLRYRFTMENVGGVEVRPQVVDDLVDALSFVSAELAPVVVGNRVVWRLAPLGAGQRISFELVVTVRDDTPPGTVIRNQATVSFGGGVAPVATDDPATAAPSDATVVVVEAPARDLVATKSLEPPADGTYSAGDEVTYRLVIENAGAAASPRLEVVDPLDQSLTGTFAGGGTIDAEGRSAAWGLAPIPAGGRVALELRARIGEGVPAGTRISNQFGLRPAGGGTFVRSDDPTTPAADDPVVFAVGAPVAPLPSVACEKRVFSERDEPLPGARLDYSITCVNRGGAPVSRLSLTDELPPFVTFLSGTALLNGVPLADDVAREAFGAGLLLLEAPLAVGSAAVFRFGVRIAAEAEPGSRVANQARVVVEEGQVVATTDDPRTAARGDATVVVVGRAGPGENPDLRRFVKSYRVLGAADPGRASPGDRIEWTLTIVNAGAGAATRLVLLDPLPARARYVAGSVLSDGRPLTDAADPDDGEIGGGRLTVRRARLDAGQTWRVVFQTEVVEGPLVENQATLRADALADERSDDDGNEGNGNGPTVVPVGEAPVARLTLDKTVETSDTDALARFTLSARNTGTLALAGLTLTDELPAGLDFVGVEGLPPGSTAEWPPASRRVTIRGLSVAPGAGLALELRTEIDATLPEGTELCNVGAIVGGRLPEVRSAPACFRVQRPTGVLAGVVYQALDTTPGYQAGADQAFEGMTLRARDALGRPYETRTDAGGAFRFAELPRGPLAVEAVTRTGTVVGRWPRLEIGAAPVSADLEIVPTGRVYESRSGALIDGVQVFLYQDLDESNPDVFDAASRARRRLVAADALEDPSQQGQRTAHGGLYRLVARRPGRYFIDVVPPGELVWPSVLQPAKPGYVSAQTGAVSDQPLPALTRGEGPPWTPAFVSDGMAAIRQNHLPLDPLSALLDVTKRALRHEASVGEVVTFEVDVVNRSPRTLAWSPRDGRGGVYLADALPPGFKYVAGSAALVRVDETAERPQAADDPAGDTRLRFGRIVQEGGRPVLRPLTLPAGAHLRLRYQLVVGPNVRSREVYRNRAWLVDAEGRPLTEPATAEVVILSDPDLDQGVLIGKVFCDEDEDGAQGPGEAGLPGAMVFADTGDFAITDGAGKFHFQALEAGTHAFKIDTDSLLPGAALTTDETRITYLTRGLPAKIAFGTRCPAELADQPALELAPDGFEAALGALTRRAVVVTGNVRAQRVRVDGAEYRGGAPRITLVADGLPAEARDLHPGGDGATAQLSFDVFVPDGAPAQSWALWLGPLGGVEQIVARGEGAPPDRIPWDQRGPDGGRYLEKGTVYAYRLEVSDRRGRTWGSPAGVFGVGAHFEPPPPLLAAIRGDLFAADDTPKPLLEWELRKLTHRLRKLEGTLRLEVHGDDTLPGPEMQTLTQRRAEASARLLRGLLGKAGPAVVAAGQGSARPMAPNLSERQRARNRRVELRHVPGTGADTPSAPVAPARRTVDLRATYLPVVRIGRDEVVADEDGEFALTAAVPEDGVLEIALRDVDGRRATLPVRLHAGAPAELGRPFVVALAGSPPEGLTLGGAPLALPPAGVRLAGPARFESAPGAATSRPAPVTLAVAPGTGAPPESFSLVVLGPDGEELDRQVGRGALPSEFVVAPGSVLAPGTSVARLTVRRADGVVEQSPPHLLQSGPGTPAAAPDTPWAVFLDGRPALLGPDGRLFAETPAREGGAVLIEVEAPDGGRRAFFVRPPSRPGDAPLVAVRPTPDAPTSPPVSRDGPRPIAASGEPPTNAAAPPPASESPPGTYDRVPPDGAASAVPPRSGETAYERLDTVDAAVPGPYRRVDEVDGAKTEAGRYHRIDELAVQTPPPAGEPGTVDALGLHPYRPEGARASVPGPRRALSPEARSELAAFGRAEILRALAPLASATGAAIDVPARRLSAFLPPPGTALPGRSVPVRGTTDPENRVFINGVEFPVGPEGQFGGAAAFPPGRSSLEIVAVDAAGNRGVLRRDVVPADAQWFLLALADGAVGPSGSALDGVTTTTRVDLGDSAYVHGRGVAWLRGRVQGKEILDGAFGTYEVETHVDTARRRTFEPAFREMIDPERFYPTYGDASTLARPIHTRGPLYVLIRADENRLTVGDFASDIRGLELFRYDRSLYGAQLRLDDTTGTADEWRHEANAFVADLDAPERHAYVELRGTGGSLYYLPYEELIEGSERVYLVERDRETGIERERRPLLRDADYTIRYREGRILMKSPVPRATLGSFGPRPQAVAGRRAEVLGGHPVYLAVEMDHRDARTAGELALAAHVRETYDGRFVLGGGYLEEGQSRDPATKYRLWGAQAGAYHGRRTRLEAEWVESRNALGASLYSSDGGLTYRPFNGRAGQGARGTGLLLRGGLELDDLVGAQDRDHWYTEGYWQSLAPGFYSGGTVQSQGLEKYGALTRYVLDEHHALRLQHDGVVADEPTTQGDMTFHGYRRHTTQIGHTYTAGRLTLDSALVHTMDDEGDEAPFVTDVLNVGAEYALTHRWTLLGGQEVVVRGDARLHDSTADLLATTVGARYRPVEDVAIEGTETVRYSGDNATQIGLRTDVDDRHTLYVNERFVRQNGEMGATSVVGGEERWGDDKSGRSYGEYQLEAGELGARNRAVLGVGKRTRLTRGLTVDAAYERSQVLGGPENGEMSSDTVSLGSEWLDSKRVKVAGRYELRYDDNAEDLGRRDRLQFLTLNGADWLLTPDFTFLVRLNYSHTYDLGFEATEAELVEGSLGLAFRPVAWDDFAALIKYTKRFEQRPTDLLVELPIRDEYDVVSLVPVLELPWRFQLVEKLAWKRMATRTLNLPTVVSQTLLWINRVNYHLTRTWDAGVEYRILTSTLAQSRRHGALGEVNYIIQKKVRLGVGYNFSSFSDDEFARLDEDHGGPFFRVVANY
jgi:uncharacterized repeat protein (TIGR01451 family)